jgi:hypothetical protein
MTHWTLGAVAVAIALLFANAALAQQPTRIRGQIEKADGGMLALKTRDGAKRPTRHIRLVHHESPPDLVLQGQPQSGG